MREHCNKTEVPTLKRRSVVDGTGDLVAAGRSISSHRLMRKASCACGGACSACRVAPGSLNVSHPSDPAEIEADQFAERVMRMPSPLGIQNDQPIAGHKKNTTINRKILSADNYQASSQNRTAVDGA